jgi:hypothetical protein
VGQEIWYRGEAVGVVQEAGKTNPHDFADGMYLADTVEVATQYAEARSNDRDARRVWSVPIDTQGMKVLDLTADPRWQKFLRPDPRLPDGEVLIKQANENYGRMFQNFVKKESIDLSQYDIVIGKEYVRGAHPWGLPPGGHAVLDPADADSHPYGRHRREPEDHRRRGPHDRRPDPYRLHLGQAAGEDARGRDEEARACHR